MDEIMLYREREAERAAAANESHVRRQRYTAAGDDDRAAHLAAVKSEAQELVARPAPTGYAREGVYIAAPSEKRRAEKLLLVAIDAWESEATERRLWWAILWTFIIGCGAAWLLTIVIFGLIFTQ